MIRFFLRKSIVTICLNVSILLIGLFSLKDIANEFIPAIEIPAVAVVVPTTFLQHDRVTHEVVNPIERRLLSTGDVEKIEATLDKDRATLFIFYKWSITPEDSLQRARQVVSSVQLPEGALDPLFVLHRPTISPIYRVAFSGDSANQLTQKLQGLVASVERSQGVASVSLAGGSSDKGLLEVDSQRLSMSGLRVSDILATSAKEWSFRHFFSSEKEDELGHIVRIPLKKVDDFKGLSIENNRGQHIPLRWFTSIRKTSDPATVLYGSGEDTVILEVVKSPGSDALTIVDNAEAQVAGLLKREPSLKSTVIYNEAEKIRQAQMGVLQNFGVGVFFNSLVLIIFLGSLIGSVIASCVFPTAILGTLYIMKVSDISLNIFALNGFSLASGMITDASIVVLEAIMRRFQSGQELFKSCDAGSKDVMLGVLASALTTAAVIVPISIQSGVSSRLFSDLGIVLVTTQFISLIAVFTFVPWLCSRVLTENPFRPPLIEYFFNWTTKLVKAMTQLAETTLRGSTQSVKMRWGIPVTATVVSVTMLLLLPNSEFLPAVSAKIYSLSIPIHRARLAADGVELQQEMAQIIGRSNEVNWVVSAKSDDQLTATLEISQVDELKKLTQQLSTAFAVPPHRVIFRAVGPTPNSEPMSYDGYYFIDKKVGEEKIAELIEKFCSSPGIVDCTSKEHYDETTVSLAPNPIMLQRSNSNLIDISTDVAAMTKDINIASLANLPLSIPVELKLDKTKPLLNLPFLVGEKRQSMTSLDSVFTKHLSKGTSVDFRKDRRSFIPLYFRIEDITIGQAVSRLDNLGDELQMNSSSLVPMGTIETMNDTFMKMINALTLAAILILLVLVIQFKSLAQALIIMYSMPLSLGGAVIGLLIMGETLNVGVIVGFILLIGIVVNNGILLMDAINQRRVAGMPLLEAVNESVQARTRPILMTTFSTVFGMLPTLVLSAEGKELYQGMAIVNIFGIIFGTVLTLIVTPIIIRMVLSAQNSKATGTAS